MTLGLQEREQILRFVVNHYSDRYLYDTAIFYSERLFYEYQTPANLHLLAESYFKFGKIKQAYLILHDHVISTCLSNVPLPSFSSATSAACSLESRYLFARACLALDKLDEAEKALQPTRYKTSDKVSLQSALDTPGGAAGVFLLGMVCRRQHRKDMAAHYFKLCLEVGQGAGRVPCSLLRHNI